jgi:beta-aspartyl-peptidase (threonine type)
MMGTSILASRSGVVVVMAISAMPCVARAQTAATEQAAPLSDRFTIVIHGGTVGDPERLSPQRREVAERSLRSALERGKEVLQRGGTSRDAVESVIRLMEDDPVFNAGRGAVFNAAGGHELDASIMDGATRQCGAVAGVRTVKNPISLARLVMTRTRHVLLAGEGAEEFATRMQVERVENSYFSTPERREEWLKVKNNRQDSEAEQGTVGCVALDRFGHLAAGTSTGGITNKMYGRVGDSPILGAGTYADDATCGVSCTGIGEQFIRHAVAYDVSARMKYRQQSLADAVTSILSEVLNRGDGGIIAVNRAGEYTMQFNTGGMLRAAATHAGHVEIRAGR